MFLEAERGGLDYAHQWATFKYLKRLLSEAILTDVAVLVTTLVNAGHTIIKEFLKGDHVIVQEASKASNGELFFALVYCETSIYLLGDDEQLTPQEQEVARNPFAR